MIRVDVSTAKMANILTLRIYVLGLKFPQSQPLNGSVVDSSTPECPGVLPPLSLWHLKQSSAAKDPSHKK